MVQQWQSETGAGGVLAAIATPDDTVYVAVGRAGSDTGTRDVRVDDAFDVFSITKTFVSAEILLLADRGALELDDTIGSHVPELSESLDVTIRDLLGHRSGLADHRDYPNFWTDFFADLDREWTWDEAVGFALSQPTGTNEYSYSDSNYAILGHLIEAVTGKPLGEALSDDLLGRWDSTRPRCSTDRLRALRTYTASSTAVESTSSLSMSRPRPIWSPPTARTV